MFAWFRNFAYTHILLLLVLPLFRGQSRFSFVGCGYTVGLIENVPAVLPRISAVMLEQFEADSFQS